MNRAASVFLVLLLAACASLALVPDTTTPTTPTTTSPPTTTTTPPTTTLIPPTSLQGTVVDNWDRPIAGVEVRFGTAVGTSAADGSFTLATHQPGPISATKWGLDPVEIAWAPGTSTVTVEMTPMTVRALRAGAAAVQSDTHFKSLLDLAADTAVNAFVFDTKHEGGGVLYDTGVQTAHDIGAVDVRYDPAVRLAQAKYAGLYTITRIVTFEDRFFANANASEKLGGPWVDPRGAKARRYNIDLAIEACELGFDEIQFDYVRWPTGQVAQTSGQLQMTQAQRVEPIESFLAEARRALQPMGCQVGAAIFAIVVSAPDDQGIGQRPEEMSRHVDSLGPMIYPSHYSNGWLGFPDPNDHPYDVTADAIDSALPRMEGGVLRPWLQAFWWTNAQIKQSIRAAEDRGVGWMMWNIGSDFDRSALPTDDEVDG